MMKLFSSVCIHCYYPARTIADLEGAEQILPNHLAEAISYRNLDRENWAG